MIARNRQKLFFTFFSKVPLKFTTVGNHGYLKGPGICWNVWLFIIYFFNLSGPSIKNSFYTYKLKTGD